MTCLRILADALKGSLESLTPPGDLLWVCLLLPLLCSRGLGISSSRKPRLGRKGTNKSLLTSCSSIWQRLTGQGCAHGTHILCTYTTHINYIHYIQTTYYICVPYTLDIDVTYVLNVYDFYTPHYICMHTMQMHACTACEPCISCTHTAHASNT